MNKVLQSMKIAFRALRVNKLRSVLTMLGIIIGVGAVIAMVSIGNAATDRIHQAIAAIGANVIQVNSGSQNTGGVRTGNGNAQTLTEDDAKAIPVECPAVMYASPMMNNRQQLVFGNNNWQSQIRGVYPDFMPIRDMKIQDGIPFSMQDVDSAAKVAIVGKTVTDALFTGGEDPVGQNIRIRKVQFTIIGTLVPKGQSANGEDQDDQVIIPITTLKKKVQGGRQNNIQQVGQIIVQASDEQGPAAVEQIAALLRQRHRIQPNDDDDFQVRSLEDIAAAQEQQANIMGLLLASIASVSLIVGGIGIMNIMLVSVTERTKEIGLRQAVGAKTGDILSQFLVEAVTLSVLGGVIGIILGVIGSLAITYFVQWNTLISLPSIISAFVFSALVGVFFGYYPARKAAYLDPIEALRYE